ncbi:formimidoylglutamase [Halocatena pleomorpha]|uniref:Formimidoylglutamase n=1 Tax=Halocatena pleomorpha TaxID=1785090 RepID=A0A3P3RKC0_9EURY|nr:formimidoylglutamase [Halocatena pleomorpha]RRJ33825.1 formimidoylglutamase [Halocatena pleomorpha]
MTETDLTTQFDWHGSSADPNDEQFGDVTEPTTPAVAATYEAVMLGEPTDRAVIGRDGARNGPAHLRSALNETKTHHLTHGPVGPVGDLGDVQFSESADATARQQAVAAITEDIHALDARPVFLGGDNSLTYPNARPLLASGSLGIVSFDAHFDCRDGAPSSGTPYRQLFEDGLDAFAVVGARHFENTTTYADYLDGRGTVVTAEDVGTDLQAAARTAIGAVADAEQLYVSLDLDVLDATAAPGVSAPTPGGLTTRELYRLLGMIANDGRVAGFEVVECAPPLDQDDRTAVAGARAIAHVLSAWTTEDTT